MTLYLYHIGEAIPCLTIENVISYTAHEITANVREDMVVYAPLAEDCEISSQADCSETLRADWQAQNPTEQTRIEELEDLMAELLFGAADEGGVAE